MSNEKMTKEELRNVIETFSELGMDIIRNSEHMPEKTKEEVLEHLGNQKKQFLEALEKKS